MRRAAAPAVLGLITTVVSGCGSIIADNNTDPITVQRSQYVLLMLQDSVANGPGGEDVATSVVEGYGGGYVTHTSLSGAPGPSQVLTLTVVLGGGSPQDHMQGETDMAPSGIACYTFTVGYYGYKDTKSHASCAASLTTDVAKATAARQLSEQEDAEHYGAGIALKAIPTTLSAAEKSIGLSGPTGASAFAGVTAADFAGGTDTLQHKPDAALALPQPGGGCIYVSYRWIQASWADHGSAGTSDSMMMRAWAAPTDDPCTGAAALSAGGFLTADTKAGG